MRLLRAARLDVGTNNIVPLDDREGAVAEYLGIGQQQDPEDPNKKLSGWGKLVFLDDTGVLYLIREESKTDVIEEPEPSPVDQKVADDLFDSLIK